MSTHPFLNNDLPLKQAIAGEFIFLDFCRRGMESYIRQTNKKIQERITGILGGGMTIQQVNPFVASEMPRLIRYSFVAILGSLVERKLQDFCMLLSNTKGLTEGHDYEAHKQSNSRDSNFKKAKKFIDAELYRPGCEPGQKNAIDAMWEQDIEFLRACRNCIMHAGGNLDEIKRPAKDPERMRDAVGQWANYTISNGHLIFDEPSCELLFRKAQGFFTNLFCLLGDYEHPASIV